MDHNDHVALLKPAGLSRGGTWADLGAGSGAFTLALRELIGPQAAIYAVDKDRSALRELERAHRSRFGGTQNLHIEPGDFSGPLDLPALDGIVMANSLHYFEDPKTDADERGERGGKMQGIRVHPRSSASDKIELLRHVREFLKPEGILLVVEYNVDSGNMWVPYPLSFETFRGLAPRAGFSEPRLLGKAPSRFLKEFYSAMAEKQELKQKGH